MNRNEWISNCKGLKEMNELEIRKGWIEMIQLVNFEGWLGMNKLVNGKGLKIMIE